MEIYLEDELIRKVSLITAEGVERAEEKLGFFEKIFKFLSLFFFG